MPPSLPTTNATTKVPSTSAWLLLSIVLTIMLAVGRWMQPPAPARPAPTTRRVALVHPARPAASANVALVSAAL